MSEGYGLAIDIISPLVSVTVAVVAATWSVGRNMASREDLRRLESDIKDIRINLQQLPGIVVKVETLWTFIIDRGRLEAKDKGLMERNSPLMLTETGVKAIQPILPDVTAYCLSHPEISGMGEDELASVLVKEFEKKLISEVCEPNHIYLGACIVLLMEALMKEKVITRTQGR